MTPTFLWHDYETWGADARRDRPCQFAAIRTDVDLNEVEPPVVLYARPATDVLPHPEACLVTGITPQLAERKGLVEAAFAAAIQTQFSVPGTCGVGYNSMRFDDEVTRHLLYRNLIDPYAREWQQGNSRWDLIDVLRLAHALRPAGLQWPTREDGTVSFRLEHLSAANEIDHGQAHDALADVRATIALARRLRQVQPRLFEYALSLRDKQRVRERLARGAPLLHVSARYPAALGCLAPVLPLCPHPGNGNGIVCMDLRTAPDPLFDLSVEVLRSRLFTLTAELPAGVERIPLKTIHVNRSPMLAPLGTLAPEQAERWSVDLAQVQRHAERLRAAHEEIAEKVAAVHRHPDRPPETDPDLMLYSGGFLPDADRRQLDRLRALAPEALAHEAPSFQDPRLAQMLFRYRARNWPETLTPTEREDWEHERLTRLTDPGAGASIVFDVFEERLNTLAEQHESDPNKRAILEAVRAWSERILDVQD
ncbi:exodeoxyribonuclease I [Thiocapsa imhoffii]|uniref:Exodeoxyribonuclease I n=1 Tax=Thiocapsa imhoffii TaxID=382777 RepID=A0A9X0WK59_9GAMM|nr:exodeoxyribonuclease I [Thiocapsa imhoffii]